MPQKSSLKNPEKVCDPPFWCLFSLMTLPSEAPALPPKKKHTFPYQLDYSVNLKNKNQSDWLITFDTQLKTALSLP